MSTLGCHTLKFRLDVLRKRGDRDSGHFVVPQPVEAHNGVADSLRVTATFPGGPDVNRLDVAFGR